MPCSTAVSRSSIINDISENHTIVSASSWYALRVRSRFEVLTSKSLRDLGYEQFLPTRLERRQWSDRQKAIEVPMFPGYVFCRFAAPQYHRVLNLRGVVHVVSAGRRPLPIPEHEIASIQAICCSGLIAEPHLFMQTGDQIRIERGPLVGVEGLILRVERRLRVVVSISILQCSIAADIHREWVRTE